ncbi:hypothetical protein ACQPZZ_04455 [Microbispora sp. CA-135349]|uniref:hypothetical protein n=1 Tax=Microbispora sp. CA-135349 TaxID=3239953 RepID=UPI003D90C19E
MAGTYVLALGPSGPTRAKAVSLQALQYTERKDLQQWIITYPELVEEGLLVLTEEHDRWASADGAPVKDRLDLLALDQAGRLVVIELKRDDAPTDVHLQALTYAAMVSRLTEQDLAGILARFSEKRGEPLTEEEAVRRLREHAGGEELDPQILRQPRIIVVARRFPPQVLSSVVWLNEMGIEIKLLQVQAWLAGGSPVLTSTTLYPVPGTEDFVVQPMREDKAKAAARAVESGRNTRAVRRIVERGLIEPGAVLHLRLEPPAPEFSAAFEEIAKWVGQDPRRGRATWVADAFRPLKWAYDEQQYPPTTLIKTIVEQVTGDRPASANGAKWWCLESGLTIGQVADQSEGELPAGTVSGEPV